ncbi:MAG: hypothetical protein AseanaTS_06700 [Candidatus Pelagadaptatus aseana]
MLCLFAIVAAKVTIGLKAATKFWVIVLLPDATVEGLWIQIEAIFSSLFPLGHAGQRLTDGGGDAAHAAAGSAFHGGTLARSNLVLYSKAYYFAIGNEK